MKPLYAVALFHDDGSFVKYFCSGRNAPDRPSVYQRLSTARSIATTKSKIFGSGYVVKIIMFTDGKVLDI